MGVLLGRLLDWRRLESARAAPFATATAADSRLQRRAREMERTGLLSEPVVCRHSVAFMFGEKSDEVMYEDVMYVRSVPANRASNEDLCRRHEGLPVSAQLGQNTARMETIRMPSTGWKICIRLTACPCRFFVKFACCVHIEFAQNARGHIDLFGRERLVYRGVAKKRWTTTGRHGPGRLT
eukprot:jgi/Phyca11/96288/e_gw1.1.658.1